MTAPTLDTSYRPSLPTVLAGSSNPSGIAVAALLPDGSVGNGAPEAIAITALDTSLGAWQYSVNGGASWLTIDADLINSTSNELALLLGPTAKLRLLPFGQLHGALDRAITFRAWDMSAGAEGDYYTIDEVGGVSSFSTDRGHASLSVAGANAAPAFVAANGDGVVLEAISDSSWSLYDLGRSVSVQPDGKIVVAGISYDTFNPSVDDKYVSSALRLNPDGSLDTSFSGDGKLFTLLANRTFQDQAGGLVQPDGKVVVAGNFHDDFGVTRFNADGTPDTSFGQDGVRRVAGTTSGLRSLSLQADGKLILAGHDLVRLNADGSTDTSFGVLGVAHGFDEAYYVGVTLQADGKIVMSGRSDSYDFQLARLNADGTVDSSFGKGGRATIEVGGQDMGFSVAVQPDGKIVVAGQSEVGVITDICVLRVNADGSLDTGFSGDGKLAIDLGGAYENVQSVLLQPDGKIVLAGFSMNPGKAEFALLRLDPNGDLDRTFGTAGKLLLPLGPGDSVGYSVALQSDGKLVLAGQSDYSAGQGPLVHGIAVLRVNADGSLDSDFGGVASGATAYTPLDAPVVLDAARGIYDPELAALNGGSGDYGGASVSLARHGGAVSADQFGGSGELSLLAGSAMLEGVNVGTVSNGGGALQITFNHAATQARVNAVLSSISYANSSSHPPASVQIDWHFDDGNSGSQGSGGAQGVTVSTSVQMPVAVPGLPATPGGTVVAGDGNGDGIADSAQSAVTSAAIFQSGSAASNPGNAPTIYVTLAANAPGGGADAGVQIGAFAQQDAPAHLPAGMQMPLGRFDFSATLAQPAATEAFSLFVDTSLGANGYWVENNGVWVNLASAAYGGQIVALEGGKTRLDFKLTDGGAFDTDHAANGSIDNVGAVGAMPLTLVGFAPPAPQAGGHWF